MQTSKYLSITILSNLYFTSSLKENSNAVYNPGKNLIVILVEVSNSFFFKIVAKQYDLHSSSTIVTVALPGLPRVRSSGSEDGSIVTVKSSSPSNISSSFIVTSNGTLVSPAGNVTVYGPES